MPRNWQGISLVSWRWLALVVILANAAHAQTEPIDEARLIKAVVDQCRIDLVGWVKAFDDTKLVFSGMPASSALICAEERIDRGTLSERVRWYGFNREAARADWMQVRENFGPAVYIESIKNKFTEPDGSIVLSPEDMDVANIMLADSSSLKTLLDNLK